ncbi:MAG TPA: hypothetical protein VM819_03300 [Vicinamibacterales bacterium]|nr:hypothetical protein [Vicinamibacterales bacterium]
MTHFRGRQTWVLHGLSVILAFSATLTGTQAAACSKRDQGARTKVVARLYNTAQVPAVTRDNALAVATRALSPGIEIVWRSCDLPQVCGAVLTTGELVIRLVRTRAGRGNGAAFALGDALIDMAAGAGVFATIYVDRVEQMAEISEIDREVLLGRAIAHELGHLLLMTNAHTSSGLMRARWTAPVIRRSHPGDWALTKGDIATIQKRLR